MRSYRAEVTYTFRCACGDKIRAGSVEELDRKIADHRAEECRDRLLDDHTIHPNRA